MLYLCREERDILQIEPCQKLQFGQWLTRNLLLQHVIFIEITTMR